MNAETRQALSLASWSRDGRGYLVIGRQPQNQVAGSRPHARGALLKASNNPRLGCSRIRVVDERRCATGYRRSGRRRRLGCAPGPSWERSPCGSGRRFALGSANWERWRALALGAVWPWRPWQRQLEDRSARTQIAFAIDATGFPRTEGHFRRFEGRIAVDFDRPEKSASPSMCSRVRSTSAPLRSATI